MRCGNRPATIITGYDTRRLAMSDEDEFEWPSVPRERTAFYTVGVGLCSWCNENDNLPSREDWRDVKMREFRQAHPEILWEKPSHMSSKEWASYHLALMRQFARKLVNRELPYDKQKWITENPGGNSRASDEEA